MRRAVKAVILVVVAIAGSASAVALFARAGARSRLEATLDRHKAEGLGASLADLRVQAPAGLDPERQRLAWEWMRQERQPPSPPAEAMDTSWYVRGDAPVPPKALAWHAENRASVERLLALLRSGPTHIGSVTDVLGLPGARHPDGDDFRRTVEARIPNLLALRHAHLYLRLRAFIEEDPSGALDDLDRLRAALRPCTNQVEGMVAIACEPMRDETFLALALRGRLPPSRLAAWADEPSEVQAWIADGFRTERLGILVPMSRDLLGNGDVAVRIGDVRRGFLGLDRFWERTVLPFWRAPDDAAFILDRYAAIERWMRESGPPPSEDAHSLGWPFWTMVPQASAMALSAVGLRTQQRSARVLALLAPGGRVDEPWPADDAAARAHLREHARLLDAGPFALALRYEREEGGATRVIADAAASRHASIDGLDLSASSLLPFAVAARRVPTTSSGRASRPPPPLPALRTWSYGIEAQTP